MLGTEARKGYKARMTTIGEIVLIGILGNWVRLSYNRLA